MVLISNFGSRKPFFSQLGRYLESSQRKISTANKAYTSDFLPDDSKDLPSQLKSFPPQSLVSTPFLSTEHENEFAILH